MNSAENYNEVQLHGGDITNASAEKDQEVNDPSNNRFLKAKINNAETIQMLIQAMPAVITCDSEMTKKLTACTIVWNKAGAQTVLLPCSNRYANGYADAKDRAVANKAKGAGMYVKRYIWAMAKTISERNAAR